MSKTHVDLKNPPFVCRGRQFQLKAPPLDVEQRKKIAALIQARQVGRAIEQIRERSDVRLAQWQDTAVKSRLVNLDAQARALKERIKNLEVQKEVLQLLDAQIAAQTPQPVTAAGDAPQSGEANDVEMADGARDAKAAAVSAIQGKQAAQQEALQDVGQGEDGESKETPSSAPQAEAASSVAEKAAPAPDAAAKRKREEPLEGTNAPDKDVASDGEGSVSAKKSRTAV